MAISETPADGSYGGSKRFGIRLTTAADARYFIRRLDHPKLFGSLNDGLRDAASGNAFA